MPCQQIGGERRLRQQQLQRDHQHLEYEGQYDEYGIPAEQERCLLFGILPGGKGVHEEQQAGTEQQAGGEKEPVGEQRIPKRNGRDGVNPAHDIDKSKAEDGGQTACPCIERDQPEEKPGSKQPDEQDFAAQPRCPHVGDRVKAYRRIGKMFQ